MKYTKLLQKIQNLQNRHFFWIDLVIILLTPSVSFFFRMDARIDLVAYGMPLISYTLIFAGLKLLVFHYSGLYKRIWSKASIDELAKGIAVGIFLLVFQYFFYFLLRKIPIDILYLKILPRFFAVYEGYIALMFVAGVHFSVRFSERFIERLRLARSKKNAKTLVVGAGSSGVKVVEDLQKNPQLGLIPVAFVDDDVRKHHLQIRGVEVKGDRYLIPQLVVDYNIQKVLIAMPVAPGKVIREILEICKEVDVETLTMPSLIELVDGKVLIEHFRKVEIEDLLRRESIKTDIEKVKKQLSNKRVLISGAGGSIGSEICRQVLNTSPESIVLLGHGENSIFEIEYELRERIAKSEHLSKEIKIICRIADIRSKSRLEYIFGELKPDVVLHAAAHKHVPLMEENPTEAVSNNVFGTQNLVDTCIKFGVRKFVLISSDKAVNPANVMGATKRIAEMIVRYAALKTGWSYNIVRFGNVLDSRGSVIPTFKKQLLKGGPITVTHPDIERYFITIPEAVQLVLQASVMGEGGELFMLDMGKPVKIVDLARDLIRLSGLEEGQDVNIKYIGLRPGEKLFEELFLDSEEYQKTVHEKIFIANDLNKQYDDSFIANIEQLIKAGEGNDNKRVIEGLSLLVPEYSPSIN